MGELPAMPCITLLAPPPDFSRARKQFTMLIHNPTRTHFITPKTMHPIRRKRYWRTTIAPLDGFLLDFS